MTDAERRDDRRYLKAEQYRDSSRLNARARLHEKYGRRDWVSWLTSQLSWKDGGRCIDIGCGPGSFWEAAVLNLPAGLMVELVDLSPGMVRTAIDRVRRLGTYAHVDGCEADAQALPYPDGAYDTALAIHMLYHLPEPARGVAEIRRLLARNGEALIVLNGPANMRQLSDVVVTVFDGPGLDRSAPTLDLDRGEVLCREHFGCVERVDYPDELTCTDPQDVVDYVMSLPLPDGAEENVGRLRDVVDRAFARAGGTFRITKEVGALRCRV